jgi:CubicO group peptidase (beta-lactamase class C family)
VGTDSAAVESDVARLLADPGSKDVAALGTTHALLVVAGGRIVVERYGPGIDATTTLPSWSMAKSLLHAVIGVLVGEGRIDVSQRADVPAWRGDGDPRGEISVDQLLRMSSGLSFVEVYDDELYSDTIEMLFKSGRADTAGFAADKPLVARPGKAWLYSSGTSNILADVTHRVTGLRGDDYRAFLGAALFDRIGMKSVKPLFDASGTWIASSFAFATAQDFARFGLLYLRDGCWAGERILPPGWVDHARTPTAHSDGQYGAHFWLAQDGSGIFSANGFRSQYIVVVPERDLVIVRLGDSEIDQKRELLLALSRLVRAFPACA